MPRLLKEVPKPVERPETPEQQGPGEAFEERQIAATLLQKLIRGNSFLRQNRKIFESKKFPHDIF